MWQRIRSVGDTRTGTGVGPSFDDLSVLKGNLRPSSYLHRILDATAGLCHSRSAGTAWAWTRYGCGPPYRVGRAWPTSQSPDRVMAACQPSSVSWPVSSAGPRTTL